MQYIAQSFGLDMNYGYLICSEGFYSSEILSLAILALSLLPTVSFTTTYLFKVGSLKALYELWMRIAFFKCLVKYSFDFRIPIKASFEGLSLYYFSRVSFCSYNRNKISLCCY